MDIPGSYTLSAISINRVPLNDGNDEISFRSGCADEFGCVPTHEMLLASFADFINSSLVPAAGGNAPPGRFGIRYVPLDAAAISAIHLPSDHGLMVIIVDAGTPAAKAGFQKADVLLSMAGHRVASMKDLQEALGSIAAGSAAVAHIWRGGKEMDIQVQF